IKASISFLMFTLGYFYVRNYDRFITLNKTYILVTAIIIVNLTITNYFNIGTSDYIEGTFYFGSARVNITKTLAALFICSPLMLKSVKESKYDKIVIIIIFTSLILIFIGVKRSAILSVLAGTLIYLFLTPRKGKIIKYLTYTVILLFLTSPFFLPTIEERFAAREERLSFRQESFDEEARYNEVFIVLYAFSKDDLFHKLFGSELFNDKEYFRTSRMLH